jgi:hypothetical protein
MVDFFKCLSYVAWHRDVDISLIIVPVEGKSTVQFSGPVDSLGFDGFDEMRGIGFLQIFHNEVADSESERGVLRAMAPEAWCERHGFVSSRFQYLNK